VYRAQGDYNKALDLFCRAAIVYMKRNLAYHPDTKKIFESMRDCYIGAGNKAEDFDAWFEERKATYPAWRL